MGNIIIIIVLLIIVAIAARSSLKHFKGQGGCCGGGSDVTPEKKILSGRKTGEKVVYIEGMHCENCRNSVEYQINRIEGAVAQVNLRRNLAVVSMDREIKDEDLKRAVERADFKVLKIEKNEVK